MDDGKLDALGQTIVSALPGAATSAGVAPTAGGTQPQVVEALVGLGWSAKQAEDAVAKVAARPEAEGANTPTVLRLALRELGR